MGNTMPPRDPNDDDDDVEDEDDAEPDNNLEPAVEQLSWSPSSITFSARRGPPLEKSKINQTIKAEVEASGIDRSIQNNSGLTQGLVGHSALRLSVQ